MLKLDFNNLGKVVRFHRRKVGLTQMQLANRAGVGKTMVFDLENGKQSVRLNTLMKVLEALDISLKYDSPEISSYIEKSKGETPAIESKAKEEASLES